jgi:hypothetical protein
MTRQQLLKLPPEKLSVVLENVDEVTTLRCWFDNQSPEGRWTAFLSAIVKFEDNRDTADNLVKVLKYYNTGGNN